MTVTTQFKRFDIVRIREDCQAHNWTTPEIGFINWVVPVTDTPYELLPIEWREPMMRGETPEFAERVFASIWCTADAFEPTQEVKP